MKKLRGFKYRFKPNSTQRLQLAQTFGCARYIWNWGLNLRATEYKENGKSISYNETSKQLTQLKKEESTIWLKDVASVPLQQSLKNLDTAFKNFFKGQNGYPKFKKKRNRQSVTYQKNAFSWKDSKLTLAKMKQPLKIRWSRYFEGEPKQVTVSKDSSGRYFVSFLVEEELIQWEKKDSQVGIDLGIKDVVVSSKGFASGNPKYLAKYQEKLKRLQRRLKNKEKDSGRREKARLKIAKMHAKISDCRKDFLHKLTSQLVRENQTICTETLNVKGLMANHKLAKAIADCGWGELTRQLEYKCQWHGRELVKIDQWYPSSKTCSSCGFKMDKMPLSVREWQCPSCNDVHHRDVNAAKMILAVGQIVLVRGAFPDGESLGKTNDSSYNVVKRESLSPSG
ncbi:MAG: RNA-guided endonuclease TnpB family protein [Pleurocapsa sp. MO_226.B13]|nr:RNA-guided endonuclease TnpB family protein [Pleurocapsa sp. MO_226.B13]